MLNPSYQQASPGCEGRIATIEHRTAAGVLGSTEVFVYDGNGNTARSKVIQASGSITAEYCYEYDSLGRLIRSQQLDGSGASVMDTEHLYDTDNRLTRQTYLLGSDRFTEQYTYSDTDGSMSAMTTADGSSLTFGYDALKRLSSVAAQRGGSTLYTRNYTYRDLSATKTTTQIAALTYSGLTGTPTYRYTYNANGALASQREGSSSAVTYTYDCLGQLTAANDPSSDLYHTYTYDTAGNLLTARTNGVYHDDEDQSHTYTYGNAGWADLLTAFDGQKIAYEGQTYSSASGSVTGTVKSNANTHQ